MVLRRIVNSVYVWLAFVVLLLAGGTFLFFNYGGSTKPAASRTDLLRTANAAMDTGSRKAPVKMVEYADFLCPYCSKFAHDVMPSIQSDFVQSGKVQLEFRPVAVIAPDSQRAAEGAYCAADQHKFWNYYDMAYAKSDDYFTRGAKPEDIPAFRGDNIRSLAQSAGLNVPDFMLCLDNGTYTSTVKTATKNFGKLAFNGTPTFLINNVQYQGYAPYSVVKPIIESYLK